MLRQLSFNVTFVSTGKTMIGNHDFQKGLSAITGPNESGKSMRLEMIRFALWGTKALRSTGASYKNLSVELVFDVSGKTYSILRTKSNAHLFSVSEEAKTPIAIGTSPVNAEVERIFGYNMTVFDTANACLQGEVEALSKMTDAERKRMVDKVIGLDVIDDLIKQLTGEMSGARMVVDNFERNYHADIPEPEMPENYMVSDEVKTFEESTFQLVMDKNRVESKILALNCDYPGEKPEITVTLDLQDLYQKKAEYDLLVKQKESAEKSLFECQEVYRPDNMGDLDADMLGLYLDAQGPEIFNTRVEYEKRLETLRVNLPATSEYDIDQFINLERNLMPTYQKIKEMESHKATCPNCTHEFAILGSSIALMRATLPNNMEALIDAFYASPYSVLKLPKLIADKQNWTVFNMFMEQPEPPRLDGEYHGPRSEVQRKLDQYEAWLHATSAKGDLVKEITQLELQLEAFETDYEKKISTRKSEEDALRVYETNAANYKKFQDYLDETKDWLKNLQGCEEMLRAYRTQHAESVTFEKAVEDWKKKLQDNMLLGVQLEGAKARLTELTSVRKALQDLKPRVKLFLVPSLNRVASNLLSQMTNGQRNLINVNEEFEITVDNQSIDELSGSGKAVANLAIRIGLGTVLTNRVFSVLLADEVDAAMDESRAANTAECLKNLTQTFTQIILVSHQKPEADHQIEL